VPQFRTLAFLSRHPGSSLSAAAEFIGLTLPTMSVLVDGLVQRGLIDRTPDRHDRRRVLLTLTPAGEQQHKQALDGAASWLVEVLKPLDAADRDLVMAALEILRPLFATAALPAVALPTGALPAGGQVPERQGQV
jgi:DNA-binding MarR family transcriptional regulator